MAAGGIEKEHTHTHTHTQGHFRDASLQPQLENCKWLALEDDMKAQPTQRAANVMADDQDYVLLQECHDSLTRITLSIKALSPKVDDLRWVPYAPHSPAGGVR